MNTGTARYNGDVVVFSDWILNQWTGKAEYLIMHNGLAFWVRDDELSAVRYNIPSIKNERQAV